MNIKEKEDNEKLKNKVFYLENLINKKDNYISQYKNKLEKPSSTIPNEKEVYILEPTVASNLLHDEIESYKQIREGMNEEIREFNLKCERYEKVIQEQHKEITNLRKQLNITDPKFPINYAQILNNEDEKMIIPSTSKRGEEEEMKSIRTCSDEGQNNLYSPAADKFSSKVKMNEVHKDYKEFLPGLDLTKK